jgi:hydrogenase maturation protease
MTKRLARQDLIVVGIGSTLRGDDRVGFDLVRRVQEHFGGELACLELSQPEVALAERLAGFDELLVVDAAVGQGDLPYTLVELPVSDRLVPSGGLTSHVFDWGVILALSHRLYGGRARGRLLGVSAASFDLSEELSEPCARNAEVAFSFLVDYCSRPGSSRGGDGAL